MLILSVFAFKKKKKSLTLFFLTSIVSDRNNKKMPLGDECHAWKKKTTDVKEQYDFKEVLGT